MTAPPAAEHRSRPSRGPVARALLTVLTIYRTAISPALPPRCRFVPSCSAYAVEAVETHGAARGSWLALRRLLRCHPFHAGGHDPVPPCVCCADDVPADVRTADTSAVRAAV